MKIVLAVAAVLAYAAVAACLCAAAIVNPNNSEMGQYVWCALAIAWGPILLAILAMVGAFD